ncbi:cobalamin B12-binding domain-containing protein [Fusibacter sp. 3D3]|uniref:cobalamin B12-binding domain-containing protein n=1 Tax=Fusibacter sp. 3D3 TaxID=1048380 RepID=UPI0008529F1D|nr:cobalamin B12-binding domain-containing protein [Fusibacter sp. 3D3]GAU77118.1 methionine synthase I [Fusibacter sp. 3D3]
MIKENGQEKRVVVAGALGNCVHVAGVMNFLKLAESIGCETHFLGPAVELDYFAAEINRLNPDVISIGYRLTPQVGETLVKALIPLIQKKDAIMVFGGTEPVCKVMRALGVFHYTFNGLERASEVMRVFRDEEGEYKPSENAQNLIDRIKISRPVPLLRHHFGLPNLSETIKGIETISKSGVLDIISIAPDQNAQESFFRPSEMNVELEGSGGVPVRTAEDLIKLKGSSQFGNYPLMRIYSGTRDLIQWAELSTRTLSNEWGAVPLMWYSHLDGRSKRSLENAIRENQEAMKWYAERKIPLEVNESHHWSLRESHDSIAVAMAYLAAYNAKKLGVNSYIAQYMLNTPPGTSGKMDLAKMLCKIQWIEGLHDAHFKSYRQVRAGLLHMSPNLNIAKGQLAASTMLALMLKPDIIHVVGFCEGDHAAEANEVIESCEIVQGVIKNALLGQPDFMGDLEILNRIEVLNREVQLILDAITDLAKDKAQGDDYDPLTDPYNLAHAVKVGILDAPHLKGNSEASGKLVTRMINGAVYPWDDLKKEKMSECDRLNAIKALEIALDSNPDLT